ncbi:hypothetical protein [Leptospira alexanderi]|uniref:hypothetical protein n=1 Tax=Leptospira alexanderi TaxID=100053 RepID=UPI00201501BD|nr:hypothetical protein [Leptospira alexanderi]
MRYYKFIVCIMIASLPTYSDGKTDCVRSEPTSTIASNSPLKIKRLVSNIESWVYKEEIEVDPNTKLLIENKGCESYWIEYKITILKSKKDKKKTYRKLISILELVSRFNESGINLKKIISILKSTPESRIYNKEIYISDNEFGESFTLEKERDRDKVKFILSANIGL